MMPSTWRSTRACWPSGLRRKSLSSWLSMKRFSVRTAGQGPGVATGGVGAPAAGGEPAVATAGGVAVDGDEEDTVYAQLAAPLVHAAAALRQGDVRFLRHQEGGVQAPGREGGDDAAGKKPVLAPFTSFPFIIHRHHQISTSIRPSRPLRRPGLFIGPCQEDTLRPVSFSADCPFG